MMYYNYQIQSETEAIRAEIQILNTEKNTLLNEKNNIISSCEIARNALNAKIDAEKTMRGLVM